MPGIELYSDIKNGKLQPSKRMEISEFIKSLDGKRCRIRIEKASSKRSLAQNNYIHFLFTRFTEELNVLGNEYRMSDVKELCKFKFALIDVVNENTGEIIGQRIKGSSEMNKTELSEFFEKIIRWAATDFHIELPYPGEMIPMFNDNHFKEC